MKLCWICLRCFHSADVLTTHLTEEQTHSAFPPEHVFSGDGGQQLQDAEAHHCSEAAWLRINSICIIWTYSVESKATKTKDKNRIFVGFFSPSQLSLVLSRTEESFQVLTAGGHCEGELLRLPSRKHCTDLIATGFLFCFCHYKLHNNLCTANKSSPCIL